MLPIGYVRREVVSQLRLKVVNASGFSTIIISYQGFRCRPARKDFKRVEAAIPRIHSENQFVLPLVSEKITARPLPTGLEFTHLTLTIGLNSGEYYSKGLVSLKSILAEA